MELLFHDILHISFNRIIFKLQVKPLDVKSRWTTTAQEHDMAQHLELIERRNIDFARKGVFFLKRFLQLRTQERHEAFYHYCIKFLNKTEN